MRLFLGIPLAAAVADELSRVTMRLRSGADGLRWTARESWHITLQFLGETSAEQCECIVAQLRGLHLPAVSIRLGELGCFDRSGVFFAGVNVTSELLLVQERVTAATAQCGFQAETRRFQPHITLARSKDRGGHGGLDELKRKIQQQPSFSSFVAEELLLYESFLGAGGARYEARGRFALNRS